MTPGKEWRNARVRERRTTLTWTNWTFGVWWDRRRLKAFGIDLGPLEIVWRKRHVRTGGST